MCVTGVLKNTEPLDYSHQHNFILEVKAEDCGGRQSDKALINIKVTQTCKPGWKGAYIGPGRQTSSQRVGNTDLETEVTK